MVCQGLLAILCATSPTACAADLRYSVKQTRLGASAQLSGYRATFSEDGLHIANVLRDEAERKFRVTVDGQPQGAYDELGDVFFSRHGERVAFAAREGDRWFVVDNGLKGQEFALVDPVPRGEYVGPWGQGRRAGGELYVTPDGRHVAYVASGSGSYGEADDALWFFVLDGQPQPYPATVGMGPRPHTWVSFQGFSPDGRHYAYLAREDRHDPYLVVDGIPSANFGRWGEPAFSPNSRRVACSFGSGHAFVLVDGLPEGPYHEVGPLVFSPDSRHLAYPALSTDHEWTMVVDGRAGPGYAWISQPVFSPDSQRVAYQAWPADARPTFGHSALSGCLVIVDGVEIARSQPKPPPPAGYGNSQFRGSRRLQPPGITFSPDSKHVACIIGREGRLRVVVDGREGPPFDQLETGGPVFSSDGKRVLYVGTQIDREANALIHSQLVLGRRIGPPLKWISSPSYSADLRRVIHLAKVNDAYRIVVNNRVRAETEILPETLAGVSESGRCLAYTVWRDHRATLICSGKHAGPYLLVRGCTPDGGPHRPVFSPDGAHAAFVAYRPGKAVLLLDTSEGPSYDAVSTPVFLDDHTVAYLANREGSLYRVKLTCHSWDREQS